MEKFSNLNRTTIVNKLKSESFDVLIIGGGVTGAGIALDAAARGMKAALVEMQDFSAGTSSRSTKLVHGGLRYLKQFEVRLVAEVGKERAIVYENGPHVTTPEWMLLPMHKGGTFGKTSTSVGLMVYDFLAGVKRTERRKMLGADETLNKEPLVKKDGLKGGGYYVEYRTDDARLTIEVLKAAVEKGATAVNYARADNLLYENQKVVGASITDLTTGEVFEIRADKVINATGPWVDTIREKDGSKKGKTLKLTKGVHIVIDQSRFPLKQAVYFDTPDGRMVFAIPREGKAYVGTTDTFFDADKANPGVTQEDRAYIIDAINYMFPTVNITEADVESSWAGIRPLIHEEGRAPSEISRKDEIWESESGLITIAGGKLTGYRKMAETIVDLVAQKLSNEKNKQFPKSSTKHMPISGGDVGGSEGFTRYIAQQTEQGMSLGLTKEESSQIAAIYGSNSPVVVELINANHDIRNKYQLPKVLFGQLEYAVQYEMAATPLDFFYRRTGALLFNIALVKKWKEQVVDYFADKFAWTDGEKQNHIKELEAAIAEAQPGYKENTKLSI